jgi:hypothetical protein
MATLPDAFSAWIDLYLALVVRGVRSREIAQKIELHLSRFAEGELKIPVKYDNTS